MLIDKIIKLFKIRFEGEMLLKDGTPIIVSGDFAVGVTVQVQGPDGLIPLPTGSYELENGVIFTVDTNGVITDIVEQVETPETPDESGTPVETPMVDTPVETPPTETPTEETEIPDEEDVMKKMVEELTNKLTELENKIKALEDKTINLSKESIKFESDLTEIKSKAHFVKEISKQKNEDSVSSETNGKIDFINKFKSIKK